MSDKPASVQVRKGSSVEPTFISDRCGERRHGGARQAGRAFNEKSRISQRLRANRSGLGSFWVAEPRQAAAKSASRVAKRTRLDAYQLLICFGRIAEDLLLLRGLFLLCFRLLRFLGHVALRCPTIGSMQLEHRLACG